MSFNITQIEERVAQLEQLKAAAEGAHNLIIEKCLRDNRASTQEEADALVDLRKQVDDFKSEIKNFEATLTDLRAAEEAEGRASITAPDTEREAAAAAVRAAGGATVKREPLTYEKWDQRSSYFADLVAAETGIGMTPRDEARARLERHAAEMRIEAPKYEARKWGGAAAPQEIRDDRGRPQEIQYRQEQERRDLNRSDGSGGYMVPPIWVMDEYISLARGGRIFADLLRRFPLPPGTDTINVPKISTGTAVAIQTADNAAVQETDLADTFVTASVRTIAGQQDVALQALEQSPLAFDQIIIADLSDDHAVKTDVQTISGTNSSGQMKGVRTISSVDTTAYTDASPTVMELYPKLADSWQQIATTRYRVPEVIVMHPRRWAWIMAALDSSNRPFSVFQAQGPNNAPFIAGQNAAEGFVGTSPFGPIYVDPNIPTTLGGGTEDVIIFTRPSELYFWEGPLRSRVLTEVLSGNLTVRIQLYNYGATMPDRRPESTSLVSGTGLAAPSF